MNKHHNIFLPDFLYPFIETKINYPSIIEKSYNGKDFIKNKTELPEVQFYISNTRLSKFEFKILYDFFMLRNGCEYSFLYDDELDNEINQQILEISDGKTNKINIYKNLTDEINYKKFRIFSIDESTLILTDSSNNHISHYYDRENYQIIIKDILEEGGEYVLSVKYFKHLRFMSNQISYKQLNDGSYQISDLEMKAVNYE